MFSSALSMFGQKGQNAESVGDLDGDGDVDEDDVKIQYQRVSLFSRSRMRADNRHTSRRTLRE
jgi:hypothetical protein